MIGMDKVLLASRGSTGEPAPEGVSFDGVNDYLSRGSDLVGNTDSKTFTFSCWVYVDETGLASDPYVYESGSLRFAVYYQRSSNHFWINAQNSSGTNVYVQSLRYVDGGSNFSAQNNTWINILASVDLAASQSQVYVSDVAVTAAPTVISNDFIDFTTADHRIAQRFSGQRYKGRISHLFLDYTKRDLSVEANRRLFITDDGKPADWSALVALNPIIAMRMLDKDTAGDNEGTGGDFTVNGVLDTSQRGANQDNCAASQFDGVDDNLTKSSISTSDGKQFLLSFQYKTNSAGSKEIFNCRSTGNSGVKSDSGNLQIFAANASGTNILFALVPSVVVGKLSHFVISCDMSDTNKRHVIVDNVDVTASVTWITYTDDVIDFTPTLNWQISGSGTVNEIDGVLGEIYFDTRYEALTVDGDFWNPQSNRPKSVRRVIEDTGIVPPLAMPLAAYDPRVNLGLGGDFTQLGSGLFGARGASEFIARSADLANGGSSPTGILHRNSSLSASDSKTTTLVIAFLDRSAGSEAMLSAKNAGLNEVVQLFCGQGGGSCVIRLRDSAGQVCFESISSLGLTNSTFSTLMLNVDVSVSSSNLFVNGQSVTDTVSYQNNNIDFSGIINTYVGSNSLTPSFEGQVCFVYLSNLSVDFAQEENRNLFFDQLGYPKDLSKQIADGVIPQPLFYLPFDDPDDLGKDASGNDNHFVVNGVVTQGSDFSL